VKHLPRGGTVTAAVVSGVAATLAAGAFGLSAATSTDPAPIELDTGSVDPVAPVPLDDAQPASVEPTTVSPAEPAVTQPDTPVSPASPGSAPSAGSIDS
jgi:hypothetical protein